MTSYQKLKAERDLWYKKYCEERQKLNIILFEPMNPLQYDIKAEYSINRDLEKAIFMGEPSSSNVIYDGISDFISLNANKIGKEIESINHEKDGITITFKLDPEDFKPKIFKG